MFGHLTCHCRNARLYRTNLSLRNGQTKQFPDSCLKTFIKRGLRHFVETFFAYFLLIIIIIIIIII